MGILSSLYTGVTGLKGQGEALSIYGDNIANANTTGFKVSRPEFQDVISKSLKGLLGGNQIGRGTRLAAVNPIFSQGSLVQTESTTDLAITGDGFFVLNGQDGRSYTRNGQFHFDKDGYLANADYFRVQGFQADDQGRITSKVGPIRVNKTVIDAKGTQEVDFQMNLDLRADPKLEFNIERPDRTSHFATGATVYDTAGTPHVVTLYFNKTDDEGSWSWKGVVDGKDLAGGEAGKPTIAFSGRMKFNTDGKLQRQEMEKDTASFKGGAQPDQKITFSFGKAIEQGGDGLGVTQYGTDSEAYRTTQDGYTAGTLAGLSFNEDGVLAASYTNGINQNLAQLSIAKFENPEGMYKLGQNRFRESRLSGLPTAGAPGTGGRGRVMSKNVEASTTDIADEFINLMTSQRSFQANTRVIQVADQMMQDVMNIGRG